jgi:hypothetical protein
LRRRRHLEVDAATIAGNKVPARSAHFEHSRVCRRTFVAGAPEHPTKEPMRILAPLTALVAFTAIPACTSEAASAAGTYTVKVEAEGTKPEAAALMQQMAPSDMQLNADGTWEATLDKMGQKSTTKGTWKLEGGEMVMTKTEIDGQKVTGAETLKGPYKDGSFTLEIDKGDKKTKLTMTKKAG